MDFHYILNPLVFNPFKPNGLTNPYQLDHSISVLRVAVWYFFHFTQILIEPSVSKKWRT